MMHERILRAAEGTESGGGSDAGTSGTSGASGTAGTAGAAGATGTTGGSVTGTTAASADWTTALAPEQRQLVQAKGWKHIGDVITGYAQVEKVVGVDKLPLPPKGAKGERDWSKWDGWNALGRPPSPDKYDLKDFTAGAGEGFKINEDALKGFTQKAHGLGLTQSQLAGVLANYRELEVSRAQAAQAQAQEAAKALDAEMSQKWGAQREARLSLAKAAARNLGLPAEMLDKIEGAAGSFAMLEAMANLGEKYFAEDGAGTTGSSALATSSPAAAQAEIDRVMSEARGNPNHPYVDASHPEHAALHAKMLPLFAIVEKASSKSRAAA